MSNAHIVLPEYNLGRGIRPEANSLALGNCIEEVYKRPLSKPASATVIGTRVRCVSLYG